MKILLHRNFILEKWAPILEASFKTGNPNMPWAPPNLLGKMCVLFWEALTNQESFPFVSSSCTPKVPRCHLKMMMIFFFPQESPCQTHDLRAPTQQCEGSHWAKKWDGCGTGWWPVMFFYGGENGIYLEIIAKGTESRKWRGGKNNSNIDNPSNKVIFPFRSTPFKLQVFFNVSPKKKQGFTIQNSHGTTPHLFPFSRL